MCNNYFAAEVREIEGGFGGVISELTFGRYGWRMRGSLRTFVGVDVTTCADGMALHVTLSVRCAVALPPSGCFFDQGVTTFWRRGVAYGSPMGNEFAGGVFHEEPVVAPMSPSMRPASLNASRSCPGAPAAPWWEGNGGREQTEFAALILSTHCSIFPQNQTLIREN